MEGRRIDSEKLVERTLASGMSRKGWMCLKMLSDYVTGLPDRLCLFPGGKVVFVELKTTGQKPRKSQLFIHGKLRALGFRVEVIDTVAGVNEFLKEFENVEGK